ncbi:protein of unknown function [Aminobacter niigataensis]|nr:protein of unknown function [Aminobacter niigataensis]
MSNCAQPARQPGDIASPCNCLPLLRLAEIKQWGLRRRIWFRRLTGRFPGGFFGSFSRGFRRFLRNSGRW